MKIVRSVSTAAAIIVGFALGSIVLSGCSSEAPPNGVSSTVLTSLAGKWTVPGGADETRITFDENGGFVGFDGCNTHTGSFLASDTEITLSFMSTTEVACSVNVWLGKVTSASLDGDSLVVTDSGGTQLGELHKIAS